MAKLAEYRRRRRFDVTPEPAGRKTPAVRKRSYHFVVQKHRASHLHYDFRLEWNGVLVSWAVPKGPSLDPGEKRLARAVEDHPLDYANFEGVIPAGQYGGGTVMVWDRGRYVAEGDPGEGLAAGKLEIELQGEKLRGGFALIRMGGHNSRNWLLIKKRGAYTSRTEITRDAPCSVLSGRSLRQIAADAGGEVEKAATGDPETAVRCRRTSRKKAVRSPVQRATSPPPRKRTRALARTRS